MKRILCIILVAISFSSLAQPEIWGVKEMAGSSDGGVLFKIDSASNEIEIVHRFADYSIPYSGEPLIKLPNTLEHVGVFGSEIVKFDSGNGEILKNRLYKVGTSGIYAPDNQIYYLSGYFILKLNPVDLSYAKFNLPPHINSIYSSYPVTKHPLADDKLILYTNTDTPDYSRVTISSFNLISHDIEPLFQLPSNFHIYGKSAAMGSKIYFLASESIDSQIRMVLFSYDTESEIYHEEYSLNIEFQSNTGDIFFLSGLVAGENQKLYGAGSVVPGDSQYHIFSYDPTTGLFNVLGAFSEETGGGIIGNLSYRDGHIYGNTSAGGAQNLGSVFAYQLADNQFDVLYTYDSLNSFESHSHLLLNEVGNLIGVTPKLNDKIDRIVFSINPTTHEFSEIENIKYDYDPTDGYSPGDFVHTDEEIIYGFTKVSYLPEEPDHHGSLFYKLNRNTGEYQKLFYLRDAFSAITIGKQLFTGSSGRIFGFFSRVDSTDFCQSFVFNSMFDVLESISERRYSVSDWIEKSDEIIIGIDNRIPVIYSLNTATNELDTLYRHSKGLFSNPLLTDDGNLICALNIPFNNTEFDSLTIVKFIFNESRLETIYQMNPLINEDVMPASPSGRRLSYKFTYNSQSGSRLIGDFWQNEQYSKWLKIYHRIIGIDLITNEITEFEIPETKTSWSQFSFIDDYSKTGSVYAINIADQYTANAWDCGFLRSIDPNNETFTVLDQFEPMATWYEYDDGDEPTEFNLLKKIDISDLHHTVRLASPHLKVFYANNKLNILSGNELEYAHIDIYDMLGRRVFQFTERDFYQTSRTLHISSGGYLVRISFSNSTESHKILVN